MDAVSYAHSAKQAQRIEKFIENPDSTSGILTQPSVIQAGEIVNVPVGRTAILANTQVDGDLVIDGDVFIPTGSSVDFSNGIKVNGENIALSIPTSYHLLSGNLSVDATVLTNGFGLYLYTGNATTLPTINLGMDITSQWGNTADETYGYLIKIKSRSAIGDWTWVNSVRGITKYISSNTTAVEGTDANMFTLSTVAGVTTLNIGTSTRTNTNGVTYEIEVYQTTHRKTGITNQGKSYTEHYNPDTGFTINGYEGSGLAGHEIPHSLGRELGFRLVKNLSAVNNWITEYDNNGFLVLNLTDAYSTSYKNSSDSNKYTINNSVANWNASTNQYIMFGYRNSYFDESGKLIGNFEIGIYQGTGVAGNKVTTRAKLAYDMIKRLDTTGDWMINDNQRMSTKGALYANSNVVEDVSTTLIFQSDGFVHNASYANGNASGGQYLYFGVYDNDNGSGKSKYPKATDTANVQINNGIIPLAHGIDSNGSKNSIVVANETITGLTYTEGKNYLYKTDTGYGVKAYEPRYLASELVRRFAGEQPDYYDVESNKWFNCDAGAELVTNGTFSSGVITTGWISEAGASISISSNTLLVTSTLSSSGYVSQSIATIIGKKYRLKCFINNTNMVNYGLLINDYIGTIFTETLSGAGNKQYDITFVAQSTATNIKFFRSSNTTGQTLAIDNISVFPIDIVPTTEITESRNYLNHIVHTDADGGVLYVEELPKIEYKNVIKAEEYLGKNACTAWVDFDGTTTPPTIRDSYNVSAVIRTINGLFDVYFEEEMDNTLYAISSTGDASNAAIAIPSETTYPKQLNKCTIRTFNSSFLATNGFVNIHINGGKN